MNNQNGISLTGKNSTKNNMLGKNYFLQNQIPSEIKNLKIKIMNLIILPLISKKWSVIEENIFFIETIKKKLISYYNIYKNDDIFLYLQIIDAFEFVLSEHQQLNEIEQKMYGSQKDMSTMVFKTIMIKIKPEYELYNIILGKPNKNDHYDENKIKEIQKLLNNDNMTFQKIKQTIINL
jgi:hypothetical protein